MELLAKLVKGKNQELKSLLQTVLVRTITVCHLSSLLSWQTRMIKQENHSWCPVRLTCGIRVMEAVNLCSTQVTCKWVLALGSRSGWWVTSLCRPTIRYLTTKNVESVWFSPQTHLTLWTEVEDPQMIRHFSKTSSRVIQRKKIMTKKLRKSQQMIRKTNKIWISKVVTLMVLVAPSAIRNRYRLTRNKLSSILK